MSCLASILRDALAGSPLAGVARRSARQVEAQGEALVVMNSLAGNEAEYKDHPYPPWAGIFVIVPCVICQAKIRSLSFEKHQICDVCEEHYLGTPVDCDIHGTRCLANINYPKTRREFEMQARQRAVK